MAKVHHNDPGCLSRTVSVVHNIVEDRIMKCKICGKDTKKLGDDFELCEEHYLLKNISIHVIEINRIVSDIRLIIKQTDVLLFIVIFLLFVITTLIVMGLR